MSRRALTAHLRYLWSRPAGRLALMTLTVGVLMVVGVITWVPLLYALDLRALRGAA